MGRRRPIIANPSLRKGRGDWVSPNFMLSVFYPPSLLSVTSFCESPCYRPWSYLSQLDVPLSQSGRGKERQMKMFLKWVVVTRKVFPFIKLVNVQHLISLKLDFSIMSPKLPSAFVAFEICIFYLLSVNVFWVACPMATNWYHHYQIAQPLVEVWKCHGDWLSHRAHDTGIEGTVRMPADSQSAISLPATSGSHISLSRHIERSSMKCDESDYSAHHGLWSHLYTRVLYSLFISLSLLFHHTLLF